jgi:diguanylate cyclase (GGDEF)-like protein
MNIIIYSDKPQQLMLDTLEGEEDFVVRVQPPENLANYKELNAGVLILDMPLEKIKEVSQITKFTAALLICVDEIPKDMTIRAEAYDYIKMPLNPVELIARMATLAKVITYRKDIKKISVTDELTGLYNRKYLHMRLDAEISRAKRYGGEISCLLIDIDFFKTINDMYGYDWGDVLLKKIANMLEVLIRKEDVLTRYGDEEFIVVLPNTPESQAYVFAERFRKDVEKMEFIPANEEEHHPITISGGIASYPFLENVDENSNTIVRYAEHALYSAKSRGKNQIVRFSTMNLGY